jgi:hypothetical protein
MWAFTVPRTSWMAATCGAYCVDCTEARRGQGEEHLGVIGHGGGDVVMSTLKTGVDELPSITGVQIRARRAQGGSPVVAACEYLVFAPEFITAG